MKQYSEEELRNATQLYMENEPLATWGVMKYTPSKVGDDDFHQLARIGLWKACLAYNPEKHKTKFTTIAATCMRNELFRPFRELNKASNKDVTVISLSTPVSEDENLTIADTLVSPLGNIEDSGIFITDYLSKLSTREKKILSMRMQGMAQKDIAKSLGITQAWCSRILRRIMHNYMQ